MSLVVLKIRLWIYGSQSLEWRWKESRMLIMTSSEKLLISMAQVWLLLAQMIRVWRYGVEILSLSKHSWVILHSSSQSKLSALVSIFLEDKIRPWKFGKKITVLRMFNFPDQSGAYAVIKIEISSQQVQTALSVHSQQTIAEELTQMSRKCSTSKSWKLLLKNQVWPNRTLENWWLLSR